MIRPLTIASCLLAFGSGLYLYQSKHEVQLLDKTIERTVRETGALRDQSRLLAAEWTMLNDFDRLRQFSDTYLKLKPISPAQFTSVTDLASRLPAPQAEVPAQTADEPETLPIVSEGIPRTVPEPASVVAAGEALPVPPIPVVAVASIASPMVRQAEVRTPPPERRQTATPAPSSSVVGDSQPRPVAAAPRPIILAASRPAPAFVPAVQPVRAPVSAPFVPLPARPAVIASSGMGTAPSSYGAPYGGSLLGMARGSMPAAPRPTPVSATYNTN
jgi:hypothetical protein